VVLGELQGKKKVQRSMVADNASGKSVKSEVRTSSGMFLAKRQVQYNRL
jgi:prolyl 4-hydroxylase